LGLTPKLAIKKIAGITFIKKNKKFQKLIFHLFFYFAMSIFSVLCLLYSVAQIFDMRDAAFFFFCLKRF
jgi:hypothetical protein